MAMTQTEIRILSRIMGGIPARFRVLGMPYSGIVGTPEHKACLRMAEQGLLVVKAHNNGLAFTAYSGDQYARKLNNERKGGDA